MTTGSSQLVLVVDDDSDIREALQEVLVGEGFRVRPLTDGIALADYLGHAYDFIEEPVELPAVIVTDWRMPVPDGVEGSVLQTIRLTYPDVPVVLVTGVPPARVRDEVDRNGATLLSKPFCITKLISIIETALKEKKEK